MEKTKYTYSENGFEAVLYDAGNNDDRVLIVVQGLKGLELPENTPSCFQIADIRRLPCHITAARDRRKVCAPYLLSNSKKPVTN